MKRKAKERITALKEKWQNQSIYAELLREQMVARLGLLKQEKQKILEYKKKCLAEKDQRKKASESPSKRN
jgi:hypothetical protein